MKSFEIGKNDANQRLDKFISKAVPLLNPPLMYKYIRTKRIKLNGSRAEISSRLKVGDRIDMYINDEFFAPVKEEYDFLKASKNLKIVYEDENILLLDKSVGLLSHPDDREYNDTLITRVKRYLYEKGEFNPKDEFSFAPALVNRIDRNTGGIVIAAKNAESLRILNEKLKNREIEKFYLLVVHGTMKEMCGTLTGYMTKDESKNKVTVFSHPVTGGKEMKTKYRVIREKGGLSLIEAQLLTGRTHQIRAQFAAAGHPLMGDGKYGTNKVNKPYGYKKQFLYSYKLIFDFTTDAGLLNHLCGKEFAVEDVWFSREFDEIAAKSCKNDKNSL
ncbi:MAG: RluA family pseudouridine synthase [Clostridiales bacterium]|nr:RluA family pseudouridine synthase [Clostridiales bacterium]